MLELRVSTNLGRYAFSKTAREQARFAASQAINVTAARVQLAERENMKRVLDRPTPFTLQGVSLKRSSKKTLTALVFVKDLTAEYLAPYEVGGLNKLNSSVLLKPIGQKVNQYGNLPRMTTRNLRGRTDVFSGTVFGVQGIWKRYKRPKVVKKPAKPGAVKRTAKTPKPPRQARAPKLLIQYTGAHVARQRLHYRELAKAVVKANFRKDFRVALRRAIASAP
ncbi:hypothetical protein B0G84_5724 [Paraburkholderia sp. BL8N3]|nr:hypothetical protein [Paraburkholderia sp. BL8N3]TCK36711.1 hypothetical protein B0G84_5724 [Paraburkholderia sp. BL8N3]